MTDFLHKKSISYPKKITFNWTTGKGSLRPKNQTYSFKNDFIKTEPNEIVKPLSYDFIKIETDQTFKPLSYEFIKTETDKTFKPLTYESCQRISILLSKEMSLENDSFVPLNSENKMIKIDLNKLFPNKQNIKNNVEEQNPEILSYQIILKKFQDLQSYLIKNSKGSNEDLEYISKSITKLSNYLKRKGVLNL